MARDYYGGGEASQAFLAALVLTAGVGALLAVADAFSGGGDKWVLWSAHGEHKLEPGEKYAVSARAYQLPDHAGFSWEASWRDLEAKPNDHSRDVIREGPAATAAEAVDAARAAFHELSTGNF